VIEAPPKSEFTASELIAVAQANNLQASTRLITDWVSLGLLDQPTRRGLGRGKGSVAVWPVKQVELFVDLLALRQRYGVAHVAFLANVPVLGWLYSEAATPLRQTRRALATWCGRNRRKTGVSRDTARRAARQLINSIEHPHASVRDRAALRRMLEDSMRARTFDREAFREGVRDVFDPHEQGWTYGPEEAPTSTENVVRLTEARFTALSVLERLTDQEYEDARLIYVASRAEYVRRQPSFAADPHGGQLFEEPTFNNILNNACRDLLTILGMGRLAPGRSGELVQEARPREM
jgi:hypothetical protein